MTCDRKVYWDYFFACMEEVRFTYMPRQKEKKLTEVLADWELVLVVVGGS